MLRKRSLLRAPAFPKTRTAPRRYNATSNGTTTSSPPTTKSPNSTTTTTTTPTPSSHPRIHRINRHLPAFLHRYTHALGNAPLTHMTAFLLLHELTAVIPLVGLAGYFHYTQWLPPWFAEGAWVTSGVERFGRYFRRKGWVRGEEVEEARAEVGGGEDGSERVHGGGLGKVDRVWRVGEGGVRLVVEFATAWAIVKVGLVPRVLFSVWATPWFARMTVGPVVARCKGLFARGKSKGVGGKGADGGGKKM